MTEVKRKRGRPLGSGGRDDSLYLAKIADHRVANPGMKRSTAMNLVRNTRNDWGVSDKTLLQRWRDKWRRQEVALMDAARERARPRLPAQPIHSVGQMIRNLQMAAQALSALPLGARNIALASEAFARDMARIGEVAKAAHTATLRIAQVGEQMRRAVQVLGGVGQSQSRT